MLESELHRPRLLMSVNVLHRGTKSCDGPVRRSGYRLALSDSKFSSFRAALKTSIHLRYVIRKRGEPRRSFVNSSSKMARNSLPGESKITESLKAPVFVGTCLS